MSVISFSIPGQPVPWARARAYSKGGDGIGFATAPRQRAFKKVVAEYARVAMLQSRYLQPLGGALILSARVFLEPPKRLPILPGGVLTPCPDRPDLDNWLKLPMDAMNGLVWFDDAQVVSFGTSGKFYDPGRPRLEVTVALYV